MNDSSSIIEDESISCHTDELSKYNKDNTDDKGGNGRWTSSEHQQFLKGCLIYGNNWSKVIIC